MTLALKFSRPILAGAVLAALVLTLQAGAWAEDHNREDRQREEQRRDDQRRDDQRREDQKRDMQKRELQMRELQMRDDQMRESQRRDMQIREDQRREMQRREEFARRPVEVRPFQPMVRPGGGVRLSDLPRDAYRAGDGRFYYHRGNWYSPCGGYYCPSRPYYGLMVPSLPVEMLALAFAGGTYYYANEVYYQAAPGGYMVVAPPPGIQALVPPPPPIPLEAQPLQQTATPELLTYPREGQTAAQVQADSTQCSQWASGQANGASNMAAYNQAFAMCMDSRGYTVR